MVDFIVSSACNGCRPKHLRDARFAQRSDLLSKMMQERDVARFLVAPSRFGKTALAFEYAESIFGFSRVFWVNAKSPCFLRDLDKGVLAKGLMARSSGASLVVFEDLPRLGTARAKAASECIDTLLSGGWEVVATATPGCAQVVECQPDALVIRSQEFLVSDDELKALRDAGELPEAFAAPERASDRIPGIVWGGEDAGALLAQGAVRDDPPSEVLAALFAAAVLGKGETDELEALVGPLKSDVRKTLSEDYGVVAPRGRSELFEAHPIPIEEVAQAFARVLGRVAAASPFSEQSRFVLRLADALMSRGELERACCLVDACFDMRERVEWLAARFPDLLGACCLMPAHELFESRALRLSTQTVEVFAYEALCRSALGDARGSLRLARRVMTYQGVSDATFARAAFAALRCKDADLTLITPVERACAQWWEGGVEGRCEGIRACLADASQQPIILLAEALIAAKDGCSQRDAALIARACADAAKACPSAASASCVIAACALEGCDAEDAAADRPASLALAAAVEVLLSLRERQGSFGLAELFLLEEWDKLCVRAGGGFRAEQFPILRAAVRDVELRLVAQRSAFERAARMKGAAPAAKPRASRPSGKPARVDPAPAAPLLCVNLLGGLEVLIGERLVESRAFRRQKVRTLLAILVLNQGKEILRERLAELLWPESSKDTALRNYYSAWSLLRSALLTENGECPYLVRTQYACKLDGRLLVSDVVEFDALCSTLLFDAPDAESWAGAYRRVNELYRGDLLPSENRNAFILHAREALRTRLADALVSASARLYERGEFPAATWFAQAAVQRDASREDAYTALMRAQLASGRRTAALDTFFRCKRYLSEELGIDPSPGARRIYSEIIEAEPELVRVTGPVLSPSLSGAFPGVALAGEADFGAPRAGCDGGVDFL